MERESVEEGVGKRVGARDGSVQEEKRRPRRAQAIATFINTGDLDTNYSLSANLKTI